MDSVKTFAEMQHNTTPLVSIIINCYNGEQYLLEALKSVLIQTYSNWEVIFWDNQSSDGSSQIFHSIKDSRFRYYYAPDHTKLYEGRNRAFAHARGDFVAFLDVDDFWEADKLERQIALFNDPNVGVVYGNYFNLRGQVVTTFVPLKYLLPEGEILNRALENYQVGMLTLMVRRDVALALKGPFNPNFEIIGDFDFVIRMLRISQARAVQHPIATYRIHENSVTSKNYWLSLDEFDEWFEFIADDEKVESQPGYISLRRTISLRKAVMLMRTGRPKEARKLLKKLPVSYQRMRALVASFLPTRLLNQLRGIRR